MRRLTCGPAIGVPRPYAHLRQYGASTTQPVLTPEVTVMRPRKVEGSPLDGGHVVLAHDRRRGPLPDAAR